MATVLVVEDDDVSSELVSALLERSGHDVVAATSAEEAEVLLARNPAMVVVDVRLPGLDGLSLTRKLRADPATASVPILVMSAYARVEDRAAAFDAGCTAWLSKPVDTRVFARTLSLLLRSDGPPSEG
jgi:two-component system, cell cycle response regulator DivK